MRYTCNLDSLNLYIYMPFIWSSCNLPYIIEKIKSATSVSFIVETWYLDMGMTSVQTLFTVNIKVISEN